MGIEAYYDHAGITIYCGDALEVLKETESELVQTCVTSPPYWGLRSYMPDLVQLKQDTPQSVLDELERLEVFPVDNIVD